jgi:hypothetical protein
MRSGHETAVAHNGELEADRLRNAEQEVPFDPEDSRPAPTRPVLIFFFCLVGWAAVVSTVMYLLLG